MAINQISGSQPRLTPKVMAETVAPAVMQSVAPQDTVGISSKRKPGKGVSPSSRLSDLKPEQLSSLGGGSSLESIAQSQPSTTVGEVAPLLRNGAALETIAGLMQHRKDLKVGDFVTKDKKGRTRIDPSYKDPKTMDLLKERPDITPSELSSMKQNMARTFKNPQMGKMAAEKGFELLKKRTDLKPQDMGKMLGTMRTAVAGDKNKQGDEQAGDMAALDMFDQATKLMGKRTDIGPDRVGQLAKSVAGLSSPKDRNGPQSIAEGFEAASKSLEKNVLRKPEDMTKMASTLGDHFKGGDEKSAGHRMNAFKKSSEMMGENTSVDHNSINKMLTQATQRDPKIGKGEGPSRNKRLAKVMDDVSSGVKQGTVSANDLSSHFRNQDAEKAKNQPPKQKQKEKKPGQAQEQKKQNKPGQAQEQKQAAPKEKGQQAYNAPGQAPEVDTKKAAQAGPGQAAVTAQAPIGNVGGKGAGGKGAGATGVTPGAQVAAPIIPGGGGRTQA